MPECRSNGCTDAADVTVEYESPDERLPYCEIHGTMKWQFDPRAVAVEEGVEDIQEVDG